MNFQQLSYFLMDFLKPFFFGKTISCIFYNHLYIPRIIRNVDSRSLFHKLVELVGRSFEVLILDALLLMYEHRGYIWNGPHGALQLVTAATWLSRVKCLRGLTRNVPQNERVGCYTRGH